ncbi:MAG TPA: DUF488 family protein [Stenomitos sp.]
MKIYAASYFEPENHHGKLISISRTIPKGFVVQERLLLLAPSKELLADWKAGVLDEAQYTARYRAELQAKLPKIRQWLSTVDLAEDLTLLCWERAGEFCHRNLALKLIEHHRPECHGGCDVAIQSVGNSSASTQTCSRCKSGLIPGLDWSYCPKCREWSRTNSAVS